MIGFARKFGRLGAVAALAGLCAVAVQAQVAPSGNDGLEIPEDLSILTDANPDSRRPTAVVNGQIITGTDIEHRVALILDANEAQVSGEELTRLKLQVLRNLIDETLQIQDAAAQEMAVSQDEVDRTFERVATQQGYQSLEQMDQHLERIGSSTNSLKRQIQGELAWDRIIRRNIAPFVNVSSEEVNELYERLQASRGTYEYRIGEIYMSATPTSRETVHENATQIVDRLREGGSFVAYARQFSEASTAAVGGDLGWIQLAQLQNPQLEAVAGELQPGQLAGPIEIPGGYSILFLIDRRQIGMADPRDAILSLKQISLEFPQGLSEDAAQERVNGFSQAVQQITTCEQADTVAASIGADVVDNTQIQLRALPEALQSMLAELEIGRSTPPFGSLEDGVRVLMVCGRQAAEGQNGPDTQELTAQIEDERINRRAQRYLRDLRRDAVIDFN